MKKPEIADIPVTMEKFLGYSGKMLKPTVDIVRELVIKIEKGKLSTLERIREELASKYNVNTSCPASTLKALQLLSKEEQPVCYWRVIKKNGELISKFPDGVNGHAFLLEEEGFEINFNKKNPVVVNYEMNLSEL